MTVTEWFTLRSSLILGERWRSRRTKKSGAKQWLTWGPDRGQSHLLWPGPPLLRFKPIVTKTVILFILFYYEYRTKYTHKGHRWKNKITKNIKIWSTQKLSKRWQNHDMWIVCCGQNVVISEALKYTKANFFWCCVPDFAGGTIDLLRPRSWWVGGSLPACYPLHKSPIIPALVPSGLGLRPFGLAWDSPHC